MENFSCNGRLLSCDSDSIVDPDVAGPGVIAAFLATAFMAFLAIMTGYIIDALPEHRCNRLDRLVVRGVRRFLRLKALEEPSDAAARQRKKNREQALQTFVLTLSDQQLVTGLAITLAGWVKCDISTYSFNIVAALAWFSCTTHLSTLTVLHDYFQTHPRLRVWRVLGMVLSVIGLLAAQIATFNGHLSNNTLFYCATAQGFYVELFTDRLDFHRLVIVTIWLSYAFANRLTWLYRKDQTVYSKSIVYRKIMAMLKQPVEAVPMRVHVAERSREVLMRKPLSSFRAKLGSLAATYDLVGEEFGASFLCQISWLAFSLAYGIGQTIVARQQLSHTHGDSSMEGLNVMGFGQIVAIMLLLLPLIMAGEIYQELKHKHQRVGGTRPALRLHAQSSCDTLVGAGRPFNSTSKSNEPTPAWKLLYRVPSVSAPSLPFVTNHAPGRVSGSSPSTVTQSDADISAVYQDLHGSPPFPHSSNSLPEAERDTPPCSVQCPCTISRQFFTTTYHGPSQHPTSLSMSTSMSTSAQWLIPPDDTLYQTARGKGILCHIAIGHFIGLLAAAIVFTIVLPNLQALCFLYGQLATMFYRVLLLAVLEARDILVALARVVHRCASSASTGCAGMSYC